MEILVQRDDANGRRTLGVLSVDGTRFCDVLEPALARLAPALPHPAIAPGRYRVVIDRSERFSAAASLRVGRPVDVRLPHVLDVPRRRGIRLHPFNDASESEGCLGPGQRTGDRVRDSRATTARLQEAIAQELARGGAVWLEVRNPPGL